MRVVAEMTEEVARESAAKSTGKNWMGAVRRFKEFVRKEEIIRGFQEWPPNEHSFCLWLRHCWKEKRSLRDEGGPFCDKMGLKK